MLTDTHCHLSFKGFENDWREVTERSLAAGMTLVTVGTQLPTSQQAVAIAHKFERVFAAIAVHPIHVARQPFPAAFDELARDSAVVAIGECGLDYYHLDQHYTDPLEDETIGGTEHTVEQLKAMQAELFSKHIALAKAVGKPLIIHCRDAYDELLQQLTREAPGHPGVVHSYTGDLPTAQRFLEAGYSLGFNGIVTFKKREELREVVRETPLERILLETDAPYLAPVPFRGKRNEPLYVEHVARVVAEVKGMRYDEVVAATADNANRLFNLTPQGGGLL